MRDRTPQSSADYGRCRYQVPEGERLLFQVFLQMPGYPFRDERANPAYRLLLRE